jgi:hypothetical protein
MSRHSSDSYKRTDTQAKLVRSGILRQVSSCGTTVGWHVLSCTSQAGLGLYHMLPMGQRIQEKLERLIDKHMQQIGLCGTPRRG